MLGFQQMGINIYFVKRLLTYENFKINEEEGYLKNILLSTIFSLGLKMADAQTIQNNQQVLSIVDTCDTWNKKVQQDHQLNPNEFKKHLHLVVDNPDFFIKNYIQFLPDKTVVIRPQFIEDIKHKKQHGIQLDLNPKTQQFGLHYILKF